MKNLYLALAIGGAIGPYVFFLEHFGAEGYALTSFLGAMFATPAASGAAVDLLISSVAFWVYIFSVRARDRRSGPNPWPFVVVTLAIGLSCAIPAYLYLRLRAAESGAGSAAVPSS